MAPACRKSRRGSPSQKRTDLWESKRNKKPSPLKGVDRRALRQPWARITLSQIRPRVNFFQTFGKHCLLTKERTMKHPHSLRWAIIFLLGAAVPAWSQEKQKVPPEVQQSIDAVRNHIDQLARGKGVGEITWK